MIVSEAKVVACLGGHGGDGLFVSEGDGPLRAVAALGPSARPQITPQRRLMLAGQDLFVLEPVNGPYLLPPLRVRRFDLSGKELSREEGEGARGLALLSYYARGETITRCGIDPATGRATVEVEENGAHLQGKLPDCSGIPLFADGAFHYAVRGRGLYRGKDLLFRGDPSTPQLVRGEVVCAAHRGGKAGVFRSGAWHALSGGRLFPPWRAPLGPQVVCSGSGLLVLRREGGDLPALGAAGAELPPGIYSGLFEAGGRIMAVAEAEVPSLVPLVRFDSPDRPR